MYAFGAQATKCIPILAQPTIRLLPILTGVPQIHQLDALESPEVLLDGQEVCQDLGGWNSLVRPLNTGTPA